MSYIDGGRELKAFATLSQLVLHIHPAQSQEEPVGEGLNEPMQGHRH